jgi:hypothetical protein
MFRMMKNFKFKNPLAVNENDTIGTALLKGAAEGYIKGTAAGLLGLGVLALGLYAIGNTVEDSEEPEEVKNTDEEKEESINDEIQANWDEIKKISEKDKEIVDSL